MKKLLAEIRSCDICRDLLAHKPRPVVQLSSRSQILIVGQAPGRRVHASGVPWDDKSGETLRRWLHVNGETFYNSSNFAIVPMGLCYPGKGVSGDLPPRPECARRWQPVIMPELKKLRLTLLIGWYAQKYFLGDSIKKNLTETVRHFSDYLPQYFPLVHPSPRNGMWLRKNGWYEQEVLPQLRETIHKIIGEAQLKIK